MPRDPDPCPGPATVRVCRAAGCTSTDLWRPLDVYCREHSDVAMRFRRFLLGSGEFSTGDLLSFDAARALWERASR